MAEINLVEAVSLALSRAMSEDERVIILGEDIGVNGGVFRATLGLSERFGPKRVIDTPLAEAGIAGVAVGMAVQGLIPVAEVQFMGFAYPTLDNLINHAARLRTRTRGRLTCPMVMRMTVGAGIRAPEHHSESMEALFAHIPGLRVVTPSSPQNAYGLLLSSIRDPDPVVFLEPTRLYRAFKEEVEDNGEGIPLDTCLLLREGTDVTLVTWGPSTREVLQAADKLAEEGVSAEVIDVATLKPLDEETILQSVARTGRCVIVHEATYTGGYGGEIAARIAERGLFSLVAPIMRVTAPDVIVPLARLESIYMPTVTRILDACRAVLTYS